jgi:hypothetical protein
MFRRAGRLHEMKNHSDRWMRLIVVATGAVVVGCREAPAADAGADAHVVDAGTDIGADVGADSGSGPLTDAGTDAPADAAPREDTGVAACTDLDDLPFALDPTSPTPQVQAAVAFDGTTVWVAYTGTDAGDFAVRLVRIGCDGRRREPPFVAQSTPGVGLDPSIGVLEDRVVVSWHGAVSGTTSFRLFALDGSPLGDQIELVTTRGGTTAGPSIGAELAAWGDGFAIAGTRRSEGGEGSSESFVQRIAADGTLMGEAMVPVPAAPSAGGPLCWGPSVAADASRTWLALDAYTTADGQAVWTGELPGATELTLAGSSQCAAIVLDGPHAWTAVTGELADSHDEVRLVDAALPSASRVPLVVHDPTLQNHFPELARSDGALVLAWLRGVDVVETQQVLVAPIDGSGATPVRGAEIEVATGGAPYQPAIVHIRDDWWFVAWSRGPHPRYELAGRFMRIPAP